MNIFQYLESRFAALSIEVQTLEKDASMIAKDAELKAIYDLTKLGRTLLKLLMIPKVLIGFVLVKLHIKPQPQSANEIIAARVPKQ